MRLFVPSNWDDRLIEELTPWGERITLYAKAAEDLIGGGRPRFVLPDPDRQAIQQHIDLAHSRGMKFSYLLNSACLGNMEMTREGLAAMREAIRATVELGVDEITVSTRIMLDLIKEIAPEMPVGVGFFAQIDSVAKARRWQEAGAGKLALYPAVNRDFQLLSAIRHAVDCELQVFATLTCLWQCHNIVSCGNTIAHSTNAGESGDGHMLDHPLYECQLQQLKNPEKILMSRWIRPEDLHCYKDLGMDEVKITERFNKTDTLVAKVNAYVNERWDGNLLDLFASFLFNKDLSLEPENKLAMIRRLKKAPFKPQFLPNYANAPDLYLDGSKLEGFLEGFSKRDCARTDCETCGWCHHFMTEALGMDEEKRQQMIAEYEKFFEAFLSGEIYREQ